jgi:hypothetical protein
MDHGSWPEGRHAGVVAERGRRVADYAARPTGACRSADQQGNGERRDLGLTGLIPAAHFTPDDQVALVYAQYARYAAITRGELARARYLLELSDAA